MVLLYINDIFAHFFHFTKVCSILSKESIDKIEHFPNNFIQTGCLVLNGNQITEIPENVER